MTIKRNLREIGNYLFYYSLESDSKGYYYFLDYNLLDFDLLDFDLLDFNLLDFNLLNFDILDSKEIVILLNFFDFLPLFLFFILLL